jgi:hypothetical protein
MAYGGEMQNAEQRKNQMWEKPGQSIVQRASRNLLGGFCRAASGWSWNYKNFGDGFRYADGRNEKSDALIT